MLNTILVILFICIGFYLVFVKGNTFKSAGQTTGICVEVRTEISRHDGNPYDKQMRGMDPRMYRPYVKYEWEGAEYTAKSFRAYSVAKFFPGDRVLIEVGIYDRNVVKILRILNV